nr:TIGR04282 family arsenosugar biosynthesis glycosyltransferase [Desulfobulbaceae bacterium]
MKKQLLIFTRYPEPGKTKTRLVPALGDDGAAQLHRQMAERTVSMAASFAKAHDCALTIYYQGGRVSSMKNWLGDHAYQEQYPGDLGQRLVQGFKTSFLAKNSSVIAVGTDCPGLGNDLLVKAFAALPKADVVLGPAFDGGYYLIGLSRLHAELFTDIDWGTGSVLSQTLQKADQNNLTSTILEPLHDIDRPEDIKHLSYHSLPE